MEVSSSHTSRWRSTKSHGDVVRLMVNRNPRRTCINFGEGVTDGAQWTEAKAD